MPNTLTNFARHKSLHISNKHSEELTSMQLVDEDDLIDIEANEITKLPIPEPITTQPQTTTLHREEPNLRPKTYFYKSAMENVNASSGLPSTTNQDFFRPQLINHDSIVSRPYNEDEDPQGGDLF
jgi:hypothetical protein